MDQARSALEYVLANARTGGTLAARLRVVRSRWRKVFALLGRGWIDPGTGTRYFSADPPRRPRRVPVDVLFLDRDGMVLQAIHSLPSFEAMRSEGVHSIVELPAGTLMALDTAPGDHVDMYRAQPSPFWGGVTDRDEQPAEPRVDERT